jgi:integrase
MTMKKLPRHQFIYGRFASDGRLTSYQVKIRKTGYPKFTKSFDDLESAKAAVSQIVYDQSHGIKADRLSAERITLADILQQFANDLKRGVIPQSDPHATASRIERFIRDESIVHYSMANLSETCWRDYIADRLQDVKPSTVKRELADIRPIVRKASKKMFLDDSLAEVPSPFVEDTEIPRIPPNVEIALFEQLALRENPFVYPAAVFSIETAARRSETLNVKWENYNRSKGTIWLARGKNGSGRHILLTELAIETLEKLPNANSRKGCIFDTTAETIKKAFERARDDAGAKWVRWHDFRHEAISRCFEDGWNIEQVMDFSGHRDIKSLLRYRNILVDDKVALLRQMEARRKQAKENS